MQRHASPSRRRDSKSFYGIRKYTKLQLQFHKDVPRLLNSSRNARISADDCLIVFGRVYSSYVISQLKREGKLRMCAQQRPESLK